VRNCNTASMSWAWRCCSFSTALRHVTDPPPGKSILSNTVRSHGRNPTMRSVIAQPSTGLAGSSRCQARRPAAPSDNRLDGIK
jgi:hypothetical protein